MQFSFAEIFWLLFIVLTVIPIIKQQRLQTQRWSLIRRIEKKRRSRVITLIHGPVAKLLKPEGFWRIM